MSSKRISGSQTFYNRKDFKQKSKLDYFICSRIRRRCNHVIFSEFASSFFFSVLRLLINFMVTPNTRGEIITLEVIFKKSLNNRRLFYTLLILIRSNNLRKNQQ